MCKAGRVISQDVYTHTGTVNVSQEIDLLAQEFYPAEHHRKQKSSQSRRDWMAKQYNKKVLPDQRPDLPEEHGCVKQTRVLLHLDTGALLHCEWRSRAREIAICRQARRSSQCQG